MDQAEKIDRLTINGSRIMLLEMPFRMWRQKDIDQVRNLIEERKFSLIIAHLERFMKTAGNKEYIEELMSLPVTIQINAESLSDWKQSHMLIKMFKRGQAHILGSDCHGIHHRPPNLMEGRQILGKKQAKPVSDAWMNMEWICCSRSRMIKCRNNSRRIRFQVTE